MNIMGNRGGVPYVPATQTNAGSASTNAVYSLPDHTFRSLSNAGLMVVTVSTASASTVLGVTITVNDLNLTLTSNDNAAITSLVTGDHLFTYNKVDNTIKMFV